MRTPTTVEARFGQKFGQNNRVRLLEARKVDKLLNDHADVGEQWSMSSRWALNHRLCADLSPMSLSRGIACLQLRPRCHAGSLRYLPIRCL